MGVSIISRPEKTLSDGTVSRWNGSRTPLIYKFLSERFPVNNLDGVATSIQIERVSLDIAQIALSVVNGGGSGTRVEKFGVGIGDDIQIENTNTNLDGESYEVTSIISDFQIQIKANYNGSLQAITNTEIQKIYKDYKVFAKVYAGAPSYHPYNQDNTKPKIELGTLQIDFDSNNEGICNVRNYIKGDINSDFSDLENNPNAWTSFNIEYREYWDGNGEDEPYEIDLRTDCSTFSDFENSDFSNGLTDWLNYNDGTSFIYNWNANTPNSATVSLDAGGSAFERSAILYQNKKIYSGIQYNINVNVDLITGSGNSTYRLEVYGFNDGENPVRLTDSIVTVGFPVTVQLPFSFNNGQSYDNIGLAIDNDNNSTQIIRVFNLNISSASNPCEYSSFALLGTKQFQDPYGGNFIDYVLRPFIDTDEAKPKVLTHFDEIRFFPFETSESGTKYRNYLSGIIPDSTFSVSDGSDNLFLQMNGTNNGQSLSSEFKIESKSDGVYTYDFSKTLIPYMDKGVLQFIIKPGNTLYNFNNGQFTFIGFDDWEAQNINTFEIAGANFRPVDIDNSLNKPESEGGGFFNVRPNATVALKGEYKTLETTTPISVIEGLVYELTYYVACQEYTGQPQTQNKTYTFWLPSNYDKSDCILVDEKTHLQSESVPEDGDYFFTEMKTIFKAKSTGDITLVRYLGTTEDFNFSDSDQFSGFVFADMKFKGPISQISQPINFTTDTDCFQYKTNTLRWLNDLGGWESWTFKQYETVKESVNRTEIKHDIFNDFDNYFINGERQYQTVNVNSRKTVTLRSGHLNDNEFEVLAQIKRSIEVQMLIGDKYQTVSIANGSFTSIEEEKKVREIIFDVKLPETLVQDI